MQTNDDPDVKRLCDIDVQTLRAIDHMVLTETTCAAAISIFIQSIDFENMSTSKMTENTVLDTSILSQYIIPFAKESYVQMKKYGFCVFVCSTVEMDAENDPVWMERNKRVRDGEKVRVTKKKYGVMMKVPIVVSASHFQASLNIRVSTMQKFLTATCSFDINEEETKHDVHVFSSYLPTDNGIPASKFVSLLSFFETRRIMESVYRYANIRRAYPTSYVRLSDEALAKTSETTNDAVFGIDWLQSISEGSIQDTLNPRDFGNAAAMYDSSGGVSKDLKSIQQRQKMFAARLAQETQEPSKFVVPLPAGLVVDTPNSQVQVPGDYIQERHDFKNEVATVFGIPASMFNSTQYKAYAPSESLDSLRFERSVEDDVACIKLIVGFACEMCYSDKVDVVLNMRNKISQL